MSFGYFDILNASELDLSLNKFYFCRCSKGRSYTFPLLTGYIIFSIDKFHDGNIKFHLLMTKMKSD